MSNDTPRAIHYNAQNIEREELVEDRVPEQFRKYLVTSLPRLVAVPGHPEPAPFWIAPDMFPGVGLRVAGLDASTRVGKPHAEPHVHDTPEIYLAASEKRGDVVVRVEMDGERFEVESPFALFIPPGVRHCFEVIRCDAPNYVFGILLPDWEPPGEPATATAPSGS
jgi:mannose-6-phosphate isomerase-like protein (cupin superfamily)